MKITGKLLAGAAAAVLSFACAAAYADSPAVGGLQQSSVVRFGDLNLNRPQDVVKLYNRITLVADKLCGPRSLSGLYVKWADYASCYAETVSRTVAHVDHPALNAYYQQQMPQPAVRAIAIAQQ